MAIKSIIEEIETDVLDVVQTKFDYITTNLVPNRSDGQLTFERNVGKFGKTLKSCVLYVDIRNSVDLTHKHTTQTMGRLYTAFSKAIIKAAKYHSGHIRNIIGDRVMIVFPAKDCFTNSVDCAITINHLALFVIKKIFKGVDFKCGIGIDYGELKVIKVGVQRRGHEGTENKSLVWVGYPANIASRLTDVANKSIEKTYFEVIRNPINPRAIRPFIDIMPLFGSRPSYDPQAPLYLSTKETVEMTNEEFANNISSVQEGELYMTGGRFISFSKKTKTISYPKILMTEAVFRGFRNANENRKCIKQNYWTEQKHEIKNVTGKIFGGGVSWDLS
jgi:hypothetical protein